MKTEIDIESFVRADRFLCERRKKIFEGGRLKIFFFIIQMSAVFCL